MSSLIKKIFNCETLTMSMTTNLNVNLKKTRTKYRKSNRQLILATHFYHILSYISIVLQLTSPLVAAHPIPLIISSILPTRICWMYFPSSTVLPKNWNLFLPMASHSQMIRFPGCCWVCKDGCSQFRSFPSGNICC